MNISKKIFLLVLAGVSFSQSEVIKNCAEKGLVALTYDNGPTEFTGQLLDILKLHNTVATFHISDQNLQNPDVQDQVKRMAQEGHTVGIAIDTSWNLLGMGKEEIQKKLLRISKVIEHLTYEPLFFVRVPYDFNKNQSIVEAIEELEMIVTVQSMDTNDSLRSDEKTIVTGFSLSMDLLEDGEGSFILIQHDGIQSSVRATTPIINKIIEKNLKPVNLMTCVGKAPVPVSNSLTSKDNHFGSQPTRQPETVPHVPYKKGQTYKVTAQESDDNHAFSNFGASGLLASVFITALIYTLS